MTNPTALGGVPTVTAAYTTPIPPASTVGPDQPLTVAPTSSQQQPVWNPYQPVVTTAIPTAPSVAFSQTPGLPPYTGFPPGTTVTAGIVLPPTIPLPQKPETAHLFPQSPLPMPPRSGIETAAMASGVVPSMARAATTLATSKNVESFGNHYILLE